MNCLEMLLELVHMISFACIPMVNYQWCNRGRIWPAKPMMLFGHRNFFASSTNKFLQQPSSGLGCEVHLQ